MILKALSLRGGGWYGIYPSPYFPGGLDHNMPAMEETWVRSLGREEPLKKGMHNHSSTFIRISCTEDPSRL